MRTKIKEMAQTALLSAMQSAFEQITDEFNADTADMSEEAKGALRKEMSNQYARVEGLFGYEKYSWARGC